MQPLDVGVFQPYKHWHNRAINSALENLEFEYTLSSFFRDLAGIRDKTMTVGTIKDAWRKAGMWPPNATKVKAHMQKYYKTAPTEPELPPHPTPTVSQIESDISQLEERVRDVFSSPTVQRFRDVQANTTQLLYEGESNRVQLEMLYTRIAEMTKTRTISRRRLQKYGEMHSEDAQAIIEKRDKEREQKEAKREERYLQKLANQEKRELHAMGVICRRIKRFRKAIVRELLEDDVGTAHLLIPVPDRETELKKAQVEALKGFQLPDNAPEELRTMEDPLDQEEEYINFNLVAGELARASDYEESSQSELSDGSDYFYDFNDE